MNVYEIIFVSIIAVLFAVFLIDIFTKHAITRKIFQWKPALAAATALASAVAKVLPSSKFAIVATVLQAASDATQRAEALYIDAMLGKEDRNAYAKELIKIALDNAHIEMTPQIQEVVDGCIAVVCMLMPHDVVVNEMTNE